MIEWAAQRVTANGISLNLYRSGGDKPPLVLLHGITDSGRCWARTADALAEDYDVIALDARGHGLSDRPESGYGPADHAADVAGVIDALGLAKPLIVMGHSMGAEVAATVTAHYPAYVKALVLEDPPWHGDQPQTVEERAAMIQSWREGISTNQAMSLDDLIAQQRAEAPGWHESELRPWAESKHRVSPNVLQYMDEPRLLCDDAARQIACPFLLITGDVELLAIVPPDIAARIARQPNAQVVHIQGAGHNIRRDQFEPYLTAVREFLQRIESE
jgi:N-formylmaleamate deformylase